MASADSLIVNPNKNAIVLSISILFFKNLPYPTNNNLLKNVLIRRALIHIN